MHQVMRYIQQPTPEGQPECAAGANSMHPVMTCIEQHTPEGKPAGGDALKARGAGAPSWVPAVVNRIAGTVRL